MVKKKNVLVSVPTSPAHPYIHKACVHALLRLQKDIRYRLTVILPSHNPFENNLHHIVNDFMDGDYDYWLSFDADNPPLRNPLDLIDYDRDIIGCPTPVVYMDKNKMGDRPIYFNAYKKVPGGYTEWPPDSQGLQKVDAIGTGCFLINRRVFLDPEMRKAPFARKLNEDGTVERGNDISFCERATEQGFEIYAHFDYQCQHFNEIEALEMHKHYTEFFRKEGNG